MILLALDLLALTAVLAYSGGLLALGAIVAPTVFRSGIAGAADVMTTIFTRFDRVAIALVLSGLTAEALSVALRGGPLSRVRIARGALIVLFSLTVAVQSGALSPTIARMHREGVTRNVGPRGAEFDRVHQWSSRVGKLAVLLALAFVAATLLDRSASRNHGDGSRVDAA
jgi:hypothetical protein